jgi:spore coat polysaccharide biosynthesis predicted glycosyltransferase SpsG/ribosomal protein S18 acetylase RimI-like enzyme
VRILVHCHGGPDIGAGHVFRSAALVEEALRRGHQVDLHGTFEGSLVADRVRSLGVRTVAGPRPDAYDVVHVDTYAASGDELAGRAAGAALVSNVEDAAFGRRPADLVVDPNLGAERTARATGPVLARGSRWALLRRSVAERAGSAELRGEASRILVVLGGTDALGVTGQVLDVLARSGRRLQVTAVAQPAARDDLRRRARDLGLDVDLVAPQPDLTDLMLASDLTVSAAGTAVWELCCLGVPAALVCVADNQRAGYEQVIGRGVAAGLGDAAGGLDLDSAEGALRDVLGDAGLRRSLADAGRRLVDGRGAWRVVGAWEQLTAGWPGVAPAPVGVRPATAEDADRLRRWRDDPASRAASRSTTAIDTETHRAWLARVLADPDRHLLVGSDDQGDVGTVRWDRVDGAEWEVSITVAPDRRGAGLAGRLLAAGEVWLADREPAVSTLLAAARADNQPSLRLFRSAGYLPDLPPDDDGVLRLVRQRVPTGQL